MSGIAQRADFSAIRYAQVWEDADVLVEALAVGPGSRVLSIASAGDNALALLAARPASVLAVDLSAAQLACLALRVAAFRTLAHAEVLELVGATETRRRAELYARCRGALDAETQRFWDARPAEIARGIGEGGRFERYLGAFRRFILPLTQSRRRVQGLLALEGTVEERRAWYDAHWDNRRWRLLFRLFTSRAALGRGRDPSFLDHVEGDTGSRFLARVREAVTATPPSENPYLQHVLTGRFQTAFPRYLRPEHFDAIREGLDRLSWRQAPIEDVLDEAGPGAFTAFNLSDVFEYVDAAHTERMLAALARAGAPGARLAYWNLLVPRSRPESLADRLRSLPDLSRALHARDKAPFYRAFVVEEVVGP